MKLLQHAARTLGRSRLGGVLALLLAGALFPTSAYAAEGENVRLSFSSTDKIWIGASLILGILALMVGAVIRSWVMRQSPGSDEMQRVGGAIKDGALAYLKQQIKTMLPFVGVLAIILFIIYRPMGVDVAIEVAACFILGVTASYIAGYAGMNTAVSANMRTANAALTSFKRALEVAFRSGAVAGMVTVGVGLTGASTILLFFPAQATTLLVGFGFGGSLAALFMRVGGGIFTKAADVGADLVGKVEAGIPEDDPRNPATIADNVGDNVGDCAGMAADIFESYEVTLVAAIVLGAATAVIFDQATWTRLVIFALLARGVGVIASVIGIALVKGSDDLDSDPLMAIRKGFYSSAVIAAIATGVLAFLMMGGKGNPIQTTQLIAIEQYQQDEVRFFHGIQEELATAQHKPVYQVTAKEVLESDKAKAKGYKDEDQQIVAMALQQNVDSFVPVQKLSGFTKVTAENAKDFKFLDNGIQARPSQDPTQPQPAKPFETVSSRFVGAGSELVVRQVHVKADIPERPAVGTTPAQAAKKIDNTNWVGPVRASDLDKQVADFKKQADAQKVTASIEMVGDAIPVSLYASKDGKLALGVEKEVSSPTKLRSAEPMTFYPAPADTLNDLVTKSNPSAAPAIPPAEKIYLAVAQHATVPWYTFFGAIVFGIAMAFAIEILTDYYVSTHKKPVQEVAGVATAGAAPMIIQGFAYALESSVFMVFSIVVALLFPLYLFNPTTYGGYILSFYGIALVGLGLLTTTGYVLAMDTFGPISDNAQGVYEMSGADEGNEDGAKAVARLDAAGNTTKALTKGFAIATAVVAAVALFHSYLEGAQLGTIGLRLDVPEIFLGLLIGGAAPYLFSAFSINAVGRSAFELINEVRRQFREDPGIMLGTSRPDYARCVAIVTAAAQRELLGPGILAIALPVAVGFGFSIGKEPTLINGHLYNLTGAQALGGYLAGAILSGQLMAVLLANAGGMWDNAKKLIEDGMHGGKGTDAHKAAVVCDTVGDPFKDTAGPALNPLIKVMNLVALLLAGVITMPLPNSTLIIITLVAVAALAFTIYVSKKGSMSSAMQAVTAETNTIAALPQDSPAEAPKKRKITVDESTDEEPKA